MLDANLGQSTDPSYLIEIAISSPRLAFDGTLQLLLCCASVTLLGSKVSTWFGPLRRISIKPLVIKAVHCVVQGVQVSAVDCDEHRMLHSHCQVRYES